MHGRGACADACHEGAIAMVDGKAKLIRDDYCDGLGNCLPVCPTGAIRFEEREAAAYDEAAVNAKQAQAAPAPAKKEESLPCGCPGTASRTFDRKAETASAGTPVPANESMLRQWPVQIKLVPVNAPYFANANLLIAADCAAYAYGDFHNRFIKPRYAIGCPKLDEGDYSEKADRHSREQRDKERYGRSHGGALSAGGIERAVVTALMNCGKMIPWQTVTVSTDGRILDD